MNTEQLIVQLAAAVNMRTLYPANHPRLIAAVEKILSTQRQILAERKSEAITFLIVGDDLVVEQQVLRKASLPQQQFVQLLKRRQIERLTLSDGLTAEETLFFIGSMSTGEAPQSTPHVILGRLQIALDAEETPQQEHEKTLMHVEQVREAFSHFRQRGNLPMAPMEQMVWSFVDSLSRSARDILPLARLKEHDEYTFVHSVNVSLLVLAQARSFGMQGAMLHTFGMAGLLHDIGKLMVPLDVLNRPGKLEGEDWAIMQGHAEQGAWYLSETPGATPLSITVAYDHHLRFDGQPSYPVSRGRRLPNLATRMTSIADAYDAMSTIRPYQKPLMRTTALEILKKRAGTFYDPMLVANFVRIVEEQPLTS